MTAEVYDLDAVAAEESREPLRFRYHGQEWTLDHLASVDWRLIERANGGDIEAIRKAFRSGMGEDQAARFDEVPQPISVMTKLFGQWVDHTGLTEGESQASPDSSGSTAGPSKPASPRTTRASGSGTSSRVR